MLYLIWIMTDHARSVVFGVSLVHKFRLDRVYNFGDTEIFVSGVLCCYCLFTPTVGGYEGKFLLNDVIGYIVLSPKKHPPCKESMQGARKR